VVRRPPAGVPAVDLRPELALEVRPPGRRLRAVAVVGGAVTVAVTAGARRFGAEQPGDGGEGARDAERDVREGDRDAGVVAATTSTSATIA
jgi:hypothetical protein